MEDHETRRKIIRAWMALPKDKRTPTNRLWHSRKRRSSKTSSIAVDAIRTENFGAINYINLWVTLPSFWQTGRHGGVNNH